MSDRELLVETRRVVDIDRRTTAELLALLAEIDARKLYRAEGHSSLFTYCMQVLRLSEPAAYSRITAARAARNFPTILARLAHGDVTLTTITLLASHLTDENQAPRRAMKPAVVVPLAPARYFVKLTVGQETHDKLQRARDLLRHTIPNGDPAAIIDRALTVLVGQLEGTKHGATAHPHSGSSRSSAGRHVPAAVKRAVWARDEGRCAFVGTEGRCPETGWLEFHHVVPFAAGGETNVENLQLRCRSHNAYEAEAFFGTLSRQSSRTMMS